MNRIAKALQTIRASWSSAPGRDGWLRYPLSGVVAEECDVRGLSSTYACVSLIAGLLASLEHRVVRNLPTGGLEVISGNDVAHALSELEFTERERLYLDLALNGNSYLLKVFENGRLTRLEVLDAYRMTLQVDDGKALFYTIEGDGFLDTESKTYAADEVLHFKFRVGGGFGAHALLGVSPLASCVESMKLISHISTGTSSYYRNVSLPSGVLETDMKMGSDEVDILRARWREHTTGQNSGGTPILTHNLQWKQGGGSRSAVDNSLAEIQRTSVLEICRCFGIPPQMIGETSSLNYATSVELHRSFAAMTISPMVRRLSDAYTHALVPRERRIAGEKVDIDASALMVGSGKDKADYYGSLIKSEIISVDEARGRFNLPPSEAVEEIDPQQNRKATLRLIEGIGK